MKLKKRVYNMKFKKYEVYRYSQEDWEVIGVVTSVSKDHVTFRDLIVKGAVEKLYVWSQRLPLSFKSPKYLYLGEREDFPEYFL